MLMQTANDLERPKRKNFDDKPLILPLQFGVYLMRVDGQVHTNVPHLVVHHSPCGYEFGYGGSGPADLALNIVQWFLERRKWTGPVIPCYDGSCYEMAWKLHQEFKRKFLEPIVATSASLDYQEVMARIEKHL